MRKFFNLASAALVIGLFAGTASASPLINLEILGSTSPTGPFTASLHVAAGTTYYYEVVGGLAATGTHNSTGIGHTLGTQTPGTDGISSLSLNISETTSNPIPVTFTGSATLADGFGSGTGAQGGTVANDGHGITYVRPIQANGVFVGATSPVVIFSGSFTTPTPLADNLTSTVSLSYATQTSSGFKVFNSLTSTNQAVFASSSTESGADPYIGFTPLTLTSPIVSSVPEPSSIVLLGLSSLVAGLMVVRRRNQVA